MAKILVCGDLMPVDRIELGDELQHLFKQHEIRMANLEAPIEFDGQTNKEDKIGPHLYWKKSAVREVAKHFNLLSLANNHILDLGYKGLINTIDFLGKLGVNVIGLKGNENFKLTLNTGAKVNIHAAAYDEGQISFTDEVSVLSTDTLETIVSKNLFEEQRIIFIHGGIEYSPFPHPEMIRKSAALSKNGNTQIIYSHAHVMGVHEDMVDYGIGNFCFQEFENYTLKGHLRDIIFQRRFSNWKKNQKGIGRLVSLEVGNDKLIKRNYYITHKNGRVNLVVGEQLKKIEAYSEMLNEAYIMDEWSWYAWANSCSGKWLHGISRKKYDNDIYAKNLMEHLLREDGLRYLVGANLIRFKSKLSRELLNKILLNGISLYDNS